jgi:hypothetical protein
VSASVVGFRAEPKCSRVVPHGAYHARGVESLMTGGVFDRSITNDAGLAERCQISRKASE